MKLGTVVEGEGLEHLTVAPEGPRGRAGHLILVARLELLDDRESGLALDQREHAVTLVAAHDGVAFPVPGALAPFDLDRPVADRPLPRKYPARIVAAVTLAGELGHDARLAPQGPTGPLVPPDSPIDRLVTDTKLTRLGQDPRDLFSAPLATQHRGHPRHIFSAEVRAASAAPTSRNRVAVRLLGAVVTVGMGRVAPHLATDCGGVAHQQSRNVRLRTSSHSLSGNDVPFLLGELAIRFHGCNPFPSRMRRQPVSSLPTLLTKVLHLLCESATPNDALDRPTTAARSGAVVGPCRSAGWASRQRKPVWPRS